MARWKTMTVKVPASLSAKVTRLVKARAATRSQIVRDALDAYGGETRPSFSEAAGQFCGAAEGPQDLATNPDRLEDFGR
jgi:hypothetical protein